MSASPIPTPRHRRPSGNLHALRITVFVLFAILTVKLADMQLVQGDAYAERARNNHVTETPILGDRGLIYDRDGELLVRNVPSFNAVVTPAFLPDPDTVERTSVLVRVSDMLNVPLIEIQAAIANQTSPWDPIVIKQYLTLEQAMILEEAAVSLPGVDLQVAAAREYIGGETFSHILGYIGPQRPEQAPGLTALGYRLDEPVGQAGVEAYYESVLRGDPGYSQNEVDAFGEILEQLHTVAPQHGSSLQLSIDADLQRYIEELLVASMEDAPTASAIVMDANTGEILALVSVPTYDNNIFSAINQPANAEEYEALLADDEGFPLINHPVSDENVPGSVFKLVTAAAGLQEGTLTPESSVIVDSTVRLMEGETGEALQLIDWKAHGWVDLREAISWSSNMFFYMASCGFLDTNDPYLGAARLGAYARLFGFGAPTGIDLPGEGDGRIPTPEWKQAWYRENYGIEEEWRYGDTCQMGIGQGFVTATPLQVARMTAAVANGGTLVTPHVVSNIISPQGEMTPVETSTTPLPIDPEHLQVVREGMLRSVTGGAATNAAIGGVAVGGKTGTAEFELGPDGEWLNHAWFTAFAPYDAPEIVVTVYFELGWGGDKAAPVAGKILDYYFNGPSGPVTPEGAAETDTAE